MTFIKKYIASISWFIVMCYLLFSPSQSLPKTGLLNIPHLDKLVHAALFGIMAMVFLYDAQRAQQNRRTSIVILLIFSVVFGISSELIQYSFIPGRAGNVYDFLADISGYVLGVGFFVVVVNRFLPKQTIQ